MGKHRTAALALLLFAVGLSLGLAPGAEAARRRGALFNSRQAILYTRACPDGLSFLLLDYDPPQRPRLDVVGGLTRLSLAGANLRATVTFERLAAPVPVENSDEPYTWGGRGVLRPAAGEPWRVGDRINFTLTSEDGEVSGGRQGATVRPCAAGDPEPELHDYLPEADVVTVAGQDDTFAVGGVRVALALSYVSAAPRRLQVTLRAPDGRTAALLDRGGTTSLQLGQDFQPFRPEGGAYTLVFDGASPFELTQAQETAQFADLALRPAQPEQLRALLGARSAGQWRIEVRDAEGGAPLTVGENSPLRELQWKLELTRATQVFLPAVSRGGTAAAAPR
jgi:hypothetical protein